MKKHAYLIIAHNNFYLLEKQLILLDDERNDIYIHIDLKCKDFNFNKFENLVRKSNLTFIDRIDVKWGDCSQVEVELKLLRAATKYHYEYYHLISGVDLPLKSQNYIHSFFEENKGIEYVGFVHKQNYQDRVRYFHFFNTREEFSSMNLNHKLKFILNAISLKIQKLLRVNRIKKYDLKIAKGSNWFSITDEFANYIINNKDFILKFCRYSKCADEIFIQTMLINSSFYKEWYDSYNASSNLRLIDWDRGNPYTFTNEDYNLLIQSDALFARKFSEDKDSNIIDELFHYIMYHDEL